MKGIGRAINGTVMGSRPGMIYEGDFVNCKMHGIGKITLPNGDVYEGHMANGVKHGQGKHTCKDGKVYEGIWRNNQFIS